MFEILLLFLKNTILITNVNQANDMVYAQTKPRNVETNLPKHACSDERTRDLQGCQHVLKKIKIVSVSTYLKQLECSKNKSEYQNSESSRDKSFF